MWKVIEGHPNYSVSIYGQVKNNKRNKIKKPTCTKCGYFIMGLSKINGKTKYESIHRLVAIAFIPNPENKSQVNHIDGDKKNNCIDNLEWNTREENYHHSVKTGLRFPTLTGNRPVIKYSKEGIYIKEYPSAKFAGKDINVKSKNIWDAAKGVQSTAGGFRWAFKDRVVPVRIL